MITADCRKIELTGEKDLLRYEIVNTLKEFALKEAETAESSVQCAGVFVACVDAAVKHLKDEDPELAEKIWFCFKASILGKTVAQKDDENHPEAH